MVTVKADRAGLQLAQFGDVRLHGGAGRAGARGIKPGRHARLDQDRAYKPYLGQVRSRRTSGVEILPTTLFKGQKYVDPGQIPRTRRARRSATAT